MLYLSKSKYCSAVQCPKMLWLQKNRPEVFDNSVVNQAILDRGNEVGDLAMGLFGDYVEVPFGDPSEMILHTQTLIESETPIIAEASFSFEGLFCSVDLLINHGNRNVEMVEVKSSTKISDICRKNLLQYCGLDTLAMVKIWAKLNEFEGNDVFRRLEKCSPKDIANQGNEHNHKTRSAEKNMLMQCANCGNTDQNTLFDEEDTFYCADCCHRTLKRTLTDDLVWCPFCGMLRDRKAAYCQWCNAPIESDPPTEKEYQENSPDWFIEGMSEQNKRYWRIRKERLTFSTLISHDYPPVPLHFAPDIDPMDETEAVRTEDDLPLTTIGVEGKKQVIYSTHYERSPKLRRAALMIHGCRCTVCGFDFEKTYGELGKGYIEVHHIKPISSIAEEHEVCVEKDLVCVCSNCHRMIHRGENGTILSVERLKEIIKQNEQSF